MYTTVYRYENHEGKGPYRKHRGLAWELSNDLHDAHGLCMAHPGPWSDQGIKREMHRDEVCSCATLYNLLLWFQGYNERLFACGFEIVEYVSERVQHGHFQALVGEPRYVTNVFTSVADAIERADNPGNRGLLKRGAWR